MMPFTPQFVCKREVNSPALALGEAGRTAGHDSGPGRNARMKPLFRWLGIISFPAARRRLTPNHGLEQGQHLLVIAIPKERHGRNEANPHSEYRGRR